MFKRPVRWLYALAGVVCLAVGGIGIFVPLLPTTPFVLLAAFFFSKSSPRLHAWLLSRPGVGPLIIEWRDHRVIRPRAKLAATVAIVLVFGGTVIFAPAPIFAKVAVILLGVGLLAFILTRKSAPTFPADGPRPECGHPAEGDGTEM